MIIGVPKELKDSEYRVALTPSAVKVLADAGHRVLIEARAGEGSGFTDGEYMVAGAQVVPNHSDVYSSSEMVIKVKEPIPPEYPLLQKNQILFGFLHLAADEALTRQLIEKRIISVAFETVQSPDGSLPILIPMSEIAGKMAVQVSAHYLEKLNGGRGKLLGGVPGVRPSDVVIIGGGVVGSNAARVALGMGAEVTLLDSNIDRLRFLSEVMQGHFVTLFSNPTALEEVVRYADILVGAVLIPGAKSPKLVTSDMVRSMKPGTVIVDVAVDQGGCIETCHPTTHSNPVYLVDGVIHYCVSNMPAAVPRTSTYALSNVVLPYALKLANLGFHRAVIENTALARGVNVYLGQITHAGVAEAFNMNYTPLEVMLKEGVA